MSDLSELLSGIVNAPEATQNVVFGSVESVDMVSMTCTVDPNNSMGPISSIRLIAQSDITDPIRKGMVLIPRVGSVVMIVMESDSEGFIGLYSQVETVEWMMEKTNGNKGSVSYTAEGSKQEVTSDKGTTKVDISGEGFSQVTGDTTVDIKTEGYSQTTGDTIVDITTDGYAQTTGTLTEVSFESDGVIIKHKESLKEILESIIDEVLALKVITGMGPSGTATPDNIITLNAVKTRIGLLFKG